MKHIDKDALMARCRDKAYPITICEHEDFHGVKGLSIGEIGRIIDEMPAADVEPVRKWISVKDRLPEGDGKYICMDSHENIFDAIFYDWGKEFGCEIDEYDPDTLGFTDTEWYKYEDVEFWMKMPEPPKMDGGSE